MIKHIIVISQYFYPEQFRINDISQELVKLGYDVTVITGIPNYPEGHYFKGYGLFKKRKENWKGIDIVRIPLISRGSSSIRLILNYYSFVISGWFWSHFTKVKADIVFSFEVSPMTQTLVGKWYSKRINVKHILYVQDLWPDNLEVVGGIHNKIILNHYERMSEKIYNSCSTVLATSPSFVEEIKTHLKDKNKIKYWPQYAEEFYKPTNEKSGLVPEDPRLKIVFTGNIGIAQGLEILPKIAKYIEDVLFVIVGNGRYKEELVNSTNHVKDKFLFIDRQPAENIPAIMNSCDIAFVSFMDNPLFNKTIPAKLQSYMACGMPILAVAGGETKRIIEEAKCGLCTETGNEEELIKNINMFKCIDISYMKTNSIKYYKKEFDKSCLIKQLDGILRG